MASAPLTPFVVCVRSDGYPASLELLKIYRRLPDPSAEKHGLLRVIDESGEDYLYEANRFETLQPSAGLRRRLKTLSLKLQRTAAADGAPRPRRDSRVAGAGSDGRRAGRRRAVLSVSPSGSGRVK